MANLPKYWSLSKLENICYLCIPCSFYSKIFSNQHFWDVDEIYKGWAHCFILKTGFKSILGYHLWQITGNTLSVYVHMSNARTRQICPREKLGQLHTDSLLLILSPYKEWSHRKLNVGGIRKGNPSFPMESYLKPRTWTVVNVHEAGNMGLRPLMGCWEEMAHLTWEWGQMKHSNLGCMSQHLLSSPPCPIPGTPQYQWPH